MQEKGTNQAHCLSNDFISQDFPLTATRKTAQGRPYESFRVPFQTSEKLLLGLRTLIFIALSLASRSVRPCIASHLDFFLFGRSACASPKPTQLQLSKREAF